jgi:hypothetical protein
VDDIGFEYGVNEPCANFFGWIMLMSHTCANSKNHDVEGKPNCESRIKSHVWNLCFLI